VDERGGTAYIEGCDAWDHREEAQSWASELSIYGDTFRYLVLRKTSDEIGAANGWKFHVDGVHLNRCGGMIPAGLVQAPGSNPGPPTKFNVAHLKVGV
jgi:hypothetical protein